MRHRIFAAIVLAGTAFSPPASAQMMECTGSVASLAVAAVDTVISMLGGGRASQLAQGLQIKEAIIANFCAAEMNDNLFEINEYERRNIAHGTASNIPGINGMINRTMPGLGRGGFLMTEDGVIEGYAEVYPNMFPPLTPGDLIGIDGAMKDQERGTYLGTFGIQNRAVQEQAGSLRRSRDYAAAGRAGEGLRSELQAMNAIGGEQIAAVNSLTAATVASHRAQAEKDLRQEATTAAANATVDDYMSTLTACSGCSLSRPFLGN